jgi:hypothetical protein
MSEKNTIVYMENDKFESIKSATLHSGRVLISAKIDEVLEFISSNPEAKSICFSGLLMDAKTNKPIGNDNGCWVGRASVSVSDREI